MAQSTCNVALIGQKFMGRAHSNAWGQAPKFFDLPLRPVMHTASARNAAELQEFAARWGWAHTTTDWRSLAQNPDVHLVDIGTPNDVHAEQALAMLAAGKHVACEKPLAGTLEDARRMRDAARAHPASKTFVWFNYRRCPAVGLMRELIQEGRLGDIVHVRATYLQSWGGPETPLLWRFQTDTAGSGAHGDLNAHIIDMARFVTGQEVTEIPGAIVETFVKERALLDGSGRMGKSDVDDVVTFLARFSGGASASFEASRLAHGHQNRNMLEVNGTKGSVAFDFESMNVLRYCDATAPKRLRGWTEVMCTSGADHPWAGAWWPDAHVIGYEHGFVNMAADIIKVLGGEAPVAPLPDFEDAYRTQMVLEGALVAGRERAAVNLSRFE
ncbi:MAG: Gfo/Idh/MocA family oxidoreductase [Planctomycetota bacterium]